jgi:hypothetical protein
MLDWKRKLALIAVPAALAIGGGSLAVSAAAAAPSNTPSATQAQTTQPAAPASQPEATGQSETGPEPVEANDPALAGGGHTDVGDQADHQFDGVE